MLTVFENNPDSMAAMVSAQLHSPGQTVPASMTWNADNLSTITPADTTDGDARVDLVQLSIR